MNSKHKAVILVSGLLFALSLLGCSQSAPDNAHLNMPTQKASPNVASAELVTAPKHTREQIIDARRKYMVEVLDFDKTQTYGSDPWLKSNLVRVRVTNNATITLPELTPLTKRWDAAGNYLGGSRKPSIPTRDLKPGESVEFDYYSVGAQSGTARITVEVEALLSPSDEKFITELTLQ